MKPALSAVLVSALFLPAAPPASAGEAIVVPATPYKMFPQDWDGYAGSYALSDGQRMALHRRGLRMYAEISGRPRAELVAAAENTFVATDGQLQMTLVDRGDGNMTGAVILMRSGRQPVLTAERVDGVQAR